MERTARLFFAMIFSALNLLASPVQKEALSAGFTKECVKTESFTLTTFYKGKEARFIRIYIEGDGRAWKNKHELSHNPTPSNPLALKLAILDTSDCVAYIARPGQFCDVKCDSAYWSKKRFSEEVISAFNNVIDTLKQKTKTSKIELVGYSGGAAIAILIAAKRDDVLNLRTVAGNLNSEALCLHHKVTLLEGLDPINFAKKISHIPQRHFIASKDTIVPLAITESFVKESGLKTTCITVIKGSHGEGFLETWQKLLQHPLETL